MWISSPEIGLKYGDLTIRAATVQINIFDIKLTAKLSDFGVWWHIGGVAMWLVDHHHVDLHVHLLTVRRQETL